MIERLLGIFFSFFNNIILMVHIRTGQFFTRTSIRELRINRGTVKRPIERKEFCHYGICRDCDVAVCDKEV